MRIILMHNPTAGRGKHDKSQLMAALANAGHHAIYQSTKKSDYKKALKNLLIWCWPWRRRHGRKSRLRTYR